MEHRKATKPRNAFALTSQIGRDGAKEVIQWLKHSPCVTCFLEFPDGAHVKEFQKQFGDIAFDTVSGGFYFAEFKTEQANRYGNLFLETWTNGAWKRKGWLETTQSNYIMYYFRDTKQLFVIPTKALKRWAFGTEGNPGRIEDFPEKRQKKHDQPNDTWGRCVPIAVIMREVPGAQYYNLSDPSQSRFSPQPQDECFSRTKPRDSDG